MPYVDLFCNHFSKVWYNAVGYIEKAAANNSEEKAVTSSNNMPLLEQGPGSISSTIPNSGTNTQQGNIPPPPDTFQLLLLHPKQVKYLRLKDNFAQLDQLVEKSSSGDDETSRNWLSRRVNP